MAKSNAKNDSMIPTLAIIATLTVFFLIFGNKGPGGAARPATSATASTATDRSATAAGTRAAPPASNGSDIGQPIDSVRVDRARVALSMLPVKGVPPRPGTTGTGSVSHGVMMWMCPAVATVAIPATTSSNVT